MVSNTFGIIYHYSVYLSRGTAATSYRSIVNEAELIDSLRNISIASNYKLVIIEHDTNLIRFELMKIFQDAKVVLGLHGGLFANIVFCRENTTVIEINLGTLWRRDCFAGMALSNQLIYRRYAWFRTRFFYNSGRVTLNSSDILQITSKVASALKED